MPARLYEGASAPAVFFPRRLSHSPAPSSPRPATRAASSKGKDPAKGSPVCGVVAAGMGETVGGVECEGALDVALTVSVTVLVAQVDVVQLGVPSLVKVAVLAILSPVVSVLSTTTAKLSARAWEVPGWTTTPDQVMVPVASRTLQPGCPPQVAEPATYVVPAGIVSLRVTGVVGAVPESVAVSV